MFAQQGLADDGELPAPGAGAAGFDTGLQGAYQAVEAVDGLFIATQVDLRWREDLFTGWHLYDTSECMEMQRHGYEVVVPNQAKDFWCIHCPKEKPLAASYKEYQKIFLREYGAELHPEV